MRLPVPPPGLWRAYYVGQGWLSIVNDQQIIYQTVGGEAEQRFWSRRIQNAIIRRAIADSQINQLCLATLYADASSLHEDVERSARDSVQFSPNILQSCDLNDDSWNNASWVIVTIPFAIALDAHALQWIARVKNQSTCQLLVLPQDPIQQTPSKMAWVAQLKSLGFLLVLENQGNWFLHFDIHQYKETPDWLNAKNWAHPERWDKERW